MDEITVDPKGVLKLLNNLNIHKASGPDGLSARVLKECSSEISPMLALIYNESLAQGTVPDDWRQANVAPVFKRGEKYNAANYRPVSLTCICCKTLEHIIVSNINKHLAFEYGTPKLSDDAIKSYYDVITLLYDVITLLYVVITLLYDVITLLYVVITLLYDVITLLYVVITLLYDAIT